MITSVAYRPSRICTPYNPIIWSVTSDKINQPDFQYVIDIYVNGVKKTTITQRPNPDGYGMWDVSAIVQAYTKISNFTQGELETPSNRWFNDNAEASCHVYCKVGERYGSYGILYNGTTDTPGQPAYAVYSAQAGLQTEVTVLAASLEDHKNLWTMQNPATNGVWKTDPFQDNIHREWNGGLAWPLSTDTRLYRDVFEFDRGVLSWINWSPGTSNGLIFGFRYKVYNAAGTLVSTQDIACTTGTGMGPKTSCSSTVTGAIAAQYDLVHVNYSPAQLASLLGQPLQPGWKVVIQGHIASNYAACTFGAAITQPIEIRIKEYCQLLYPRVRLSWLNEWAGRDYFNFTELAEKKVDTKSEMYTQEQINWSGGVPVPQLGGVYPPFGTLPTKGGDKIFNKVAGTTWKLTTDWLSQEDVELLQGLQKSPQIIAYIHDDSNSISDFFPYYGKVKGASYDVKLVKQNKLTTVTVELELSQVQTLQNT